VPPIWPEPGIASNIPVTTSKTPVKFLLTEMLLSKTVDSISGIAANGTGAQK
jgi:hypothetical protein